MHARQSSQAMNLWNSAMATISFNCVLVVDLCHGHYTDQGVYCDSLELASGPDKKKAHIC